MRTHIAMTTCILALASCATETVTTVKRPDGKETTTVTTKKPAEGIFTAAFNAVLGGFLNFQSK